MKETIFSKSNRDSHCHTSTIQQTQDGLDQPDIKFKAFCRTELVEV